MLDAHKAGAGYQSIAIWVGILQRDRFTSSRYESLSTIAPLMYSVSVLPFRKSWCAKVMKQLTTKSMGYYLIIMMLYWLCRCRLIDFHAPSGQNGTHPCLFEWVKDYFEDSNTPLKPPLYLQHQGELGASNLITVCPFTTSIDTKHNLKIL